MIALFILATENLQTAFSQSSQHTEGEAESQDSRCERRGCQADLKVALTPCSLCAGCLLDFQAVFTSHRKKMRLLKFLIYCRPAHGDEVSCKSAQSLVSE